MKTLVIASMISLITTVVVAQVDSAEKKMVPPGYAADTVYNSDKSLVQDSLNSVPGNTSVNTPDKTQSKTPQKEPKAKQSPVISQDGYVMKNGKIFMLKNGQVSSTVETVSLTNGSRLMSDGTIVNVDGSKIKMKEGDFVDFSGVVMSSPSAQPTDMQNSTTKPTETHRTFVNFRRLCQDRARSRRNTACRSACR